MFKFIRHLLGYKDEFKLEVVPAWYSNDYVRFRYTINGGWSWDFVYHAKEGFLGLIKYDWTFSQLGFPLGNGDFEKEKEQFNSYEKIKSFEDLEYKKYVKRNEILKKERAVLINKRNEAYKKANQ